MPVGTKHDDMFQETNKPHVVLLPFLHCVLLCTVARVALAMKDYNARRPQLSAGLYSKVMPCCPFQPLP